MSGAESNEVSRAAQPNKVSGAESSIGGLVDATGGQEQRFAQPFRLVDEAIARKVFPGAALAVTLRGELLAWRAFGRFTYEADFPSEVTRSDVRTTHETSLGSGLADQAHRHYLHGHAALRARKALARRKGRRGAPGLCRSADLLHRGWREEVTVRMLLAHSSGLPAHRKLYLAADGREAMLAAARRVPLEAAPMERAEYSDIGFILLGELLERIAGEPLDAFCQREIFSPLKLNLTFTPQPSGIPDIPPTMNDTAYRGRIIQGEVNDENASAMGGVAGHAGLFGDALSVARFAQCMLAAETSHEETSRPGQPLFRPETVELFTTRQPEPPGHLASPGLGHPLPAIAVRNAVFPALLRSSRLHRHFALVRPRTRPLRHPAHQPHLARCPKSGDQRAASAAA